MSEVVKKSRREWSSTRGLAHLRQLAGIRRHLVVAMVSASAAVGPLAAQATGTLDPGNVPLPDRDVTEQAARIALLSFASEHGVAWPRQLRGQSEGLPNIDVILNQVIDSALAPYERILTPTVFDTLKVRAMRDPDLVRDTLGPWVPDSFEGASAGGLDGAAAIVEDFTSKALRIAGAVYAAAVSKRQESAMLLVDPSLERSSRASNWAVAMVAERGEKEAKLQLNVCDIVCPEGSVLSVTLAGPVQKNSSSTTLLDFDGLVGTSRLEVDAAVGATGTEGGWTGSLKGRLGRGQFSYVDPTSLATQSDVRHPWSFAGSAGYRYETIGVLRAGYGYQVSQRPQKPQELCVPLEPASPATVCNNTAIGAPTESRQGLLSFEVTSRLGKAAAIRMVWVQNRDTKTWLLDVPVYVIPDAEGALAGGVRLMHDFGEDESAVSLFVSLFKL